MSRRIRSRTQKRSARASSETSTQSAYAQAVARVVLSAARALGEATGRAPEKRRLVNFLRGNQFLRPGEETAAARGGYGILEGHTGDWLAELVDRLVELGYFEFDPRAQRRSLGLVLTSEGVRVCDGGEVSSDVLPRRSRLGSHPALEASLRALRREIAEREGRTAFAIFPNSALAAIAERRPASLPELAEIPGFGESRIRKYGRKILAALARANRS